MALDKKDHTAVMDPANDPAATSNASTMMLSRDNSLMAPSSEEDKIHQEAKASASAGGTLMKQEGTDPLEFLDRSGGDVIGSLQHQQQQQQQQFQSAPPPSTWHAGGDVSAAAASSNQQIAEQQILSADSILLQQVLTSSRPIGTMQGDPVSYPLIPATAVRADTDTTATGNLSFPQPSRNSNAALQIALKEYLASVGAASKTAVQPGGHNISPSLNKYALAASTMRSSSSSGQAGKSFSGGGYSLLDRSLALKAASIDAAKREEVHPPVCVYMNSDEDHLSKYQCLLRKQLEFFEATKDDVQWNAQGRNKPIVLGQVGIRCRYCAQLPAWSRARGAVYYSSSLVGLYQAAQNLSKNHFSNHCRLLPEPARRHLVELRGDKRRAAGGKKYWAAGARVLGIEQYQDGLRFVISPTGKSGSTVQG